MTTDSKERERQGQRTSRQFLWIRSPEFDFLQFTCFDPGFFRVSSVILPPLLHRRQVTQKVRSVVGRTRNLPIRASLPILAVARGGPSSPRIASAPSRYGYTDPLHENDVAHLCLNSGGLWHP